MSPALDQLGPLTEPPENLRGHVLSAVHWSGKDLRGRDLIRAQLQDAQLRDTVLETARAHGALLRGADLHGCNARSLVARDIDLEGACLQDADLRHALLVQAILLGANLQGAQLCGADLRGADLREADLRGADFSGADLRGADLRGAQLTGAVLDDCLVRHARLHGIHWDDSRVRSELLTLGAYDGWHPYLLSTAQSAVQLWLWTRLGMVLSSRSTERLFKKSIQTGLTTVRSTQTRLKEARTEGSKRRVGVREEARRIREERKAEALKKRELSKIRRQTNKLEEASRNRASQKLVEARALRSHPDFGPLHAPVSERNRPLALRLDVPERRETRRAQRTMLRQLERAALREISESLEIHRKARQEFIQAAATARTEAREKARAVEQELQLRRQQELEARASEAEEVRFEAETTTELEPSPDTEIFTEADPVLPALPSTRSPIRWPWSSRSEGVEITEEKEGEARVPDPALPPATQAEEPAAQAFDPEQRMRALEALDKGQVPGGPGADLRGLDMRGRRLTEANWSEADLRASRLDGARLERAHLTGADLRGASMDGARLNSVRMDGAILPGIRLDGSRLREAVLSRALMPGSSLVDVDLRNADLRGADLRGANLTGADLRRARLQGCDLREANLTAARMSDLDLDQVQLDRALLDQADLAGAHWEGASILEADLSGALGLSGRDRERLAARGALAGDRGLEELIGRLASRQVRLGVATLALGLGTFLAVHYLAGGDINTAELEAQAEEQRDTDPLGASAIYEELADASLNLDDKVAYRIEAAALSVVGGDLDRAKEQYQLALRDAELDPGLAADVRLHIAGYYIGRGQPDDAIAILQPTLESEAIASEVRARTIMLIRRARNSQGLNPDGDAGVVAMFEHLQDSPETLADLGMELAELLASDGDTPAALAQLDSIKEMDLPRDQSQRILEARARILDRAGRMDEAAEAWESLIDSADVDSLSHQAGRLALADLRHRQGDYEAALALVDPLLESDSDGRIKGRSWLVKGRLLETEERYEEAAKAYESALTLEELEVETIEEARISLARVLLATGETEAASDAASQLGGDAGSAIMVQARLGQARQLLDTGNAEDALSLYEDILSATIPEADLERATQAGKAEALVQLGQLDQAIRIWRAILTVDLPSDERAWIEVQLGHGLLQGGQATEAATAFRSLSLSDDLTIRYQGILGLAEVAQASGERERAKALYQQVVDRAPDPTWQVQALQELALLATAEGQTQESLAVWRTLLGRVPPGHPAAAEARISVALALAESGQFDEALPICKQAMASAAPGRPYVEAGLACGEIYERAGQPEAAITAYDALYNAPSIPADLLTDAASGKARVLMAQGRMQEAVDGLDTALGRIEQPTNRLPLLAIQAHALQQIGTSDRLTQVIAERDALADEAPTIAGPILMDAAIRARNQGRLDEASTLLERAVMMTMSRDQHVGALIELGDIRLEQGEVLDAAFRYEQALAMTDDAALRFGAGMGLAELRRRSGDTEGAVESLEALSPPDQASRRWWTEARAQAWSELGESDRALAAWADLTELTAGDPSAAVVGLRGQAAVMLEADRPEDALDLYVRARERALEPGEAGWTELGQVDALIELERIVEAEALLRGLRIHSDVEVATQAAIRHGQLAMEGEDWSEALSRLEGIEVRHLGPGWDASIVESRVQALTALERVEDAQVEWETLATRWPGEEEAILPSWLGQAELARKSGSEARALELARQARLRASDPGYRAQAEALIAALE